jgi:hypothetical protein
MVITLARHKGDPTGEEKMKQSFGDPTAILWILGVVLYSGWEYECYPVRSVVDHILCLLKKYLHKMVARTC